MRDIRLKDYKGSSGLFKKKQQISSNRATKMTVYYTK